MFADNGLQELTRELEINGGNDSTRTPGDDESARRGQCRYRALDCGEEGCGRSTATITTTRQRRRHHASSSIEPGKEEKVYGVTLLSHTEEEEEGDEDDEGAVHVGRLCLIRCIHRR